MYQVVVEPAQGERGITKRDVGMFRCPRCDASFPRVLGKTHYLLVPEAEFTRMKKEKEDSEKKIEKLEGSIETTKAEQIQREELLRKELRGEKLESLESQLNQLERHVTYLRTERDRLRKETGPS
jgi:hypothetical protein